MFAGEAQFIYKVSAFWGFDFVNPHNHFSDSVHIKLIFMVRMNKVVSVMKVVINNAQIVHLGMHVISCEYVIIYTNDADLVII